MHVLITSNDSDTWHDRSHLSYFSEIFATGEGDKRTYP